MSRFRRLYVMGVDLDRALDSPQGATLRLAGLSQTPAHGLPRICSHLPPSGPPHYRGNAAADNPGAGASAST